MNSRKKTLLLVFSLLIVFAGCKSGEKTSSSPSPTPIPKDPIPEMLNDSEPEPGEAVPQERIAVTINERVKYIFRKKNNNWIGEVIQFTSGNPDIREVQFTRNIYPELGWHDFENMVSFLKIYSLPDQSEIENRVPGAITSQSRSYKLSVSKNDSTRSYQYYNPEGGASNYWQDQNIVIFGSYLVSEMKSVSQE